MAISVDSAMINTGAYAADTQVVAADRLSSQIESAQTDEETLKACKDFEAYMLEQLFKTMEETSKVLTEDDDEDESDSTASMYMDSFKDNYYQEIASQMMSSGQGIGIAEQLYQNIKMQQLGTVSAEDAAQIVASSGAMKAADTIAAGTTDTQ